jgi:hypothetical protein
MPDAPAPNKVQPQLTSTVYDAAVRTQGATGLLFEGQRRRAIPTTG